MLGGAPSRLWGVLAQPVRDFVEGVLRIDSFLGHGRKLEAALIFVKLQYFVLLSFAPKDAIFILAFQPLNVSPRLLALPFLLCGTLQLIGLILNARGYPQSRWFRIVGATIGMMLWLYILGENVLVIRVWAAGINPWMAMGIVGSITIIRNGVLGQPRPGAPGAF